MDSNITNTDSNLDTSFNSAYVDGFDKNRESWKVMTERLYNDINHLVVKEGQLIRAEVAEKVADVKKAVIPMAVGGAMLFVGVFALTATAILLLALVVEPWIAAAIVTAVLFLVGFVMVKSGSKKLDAEHLKPRQSIETLGQIKSTFKERINEFRVHH